MSDTFHTWIDQLSFEPCVRDGDWAYMPVSTASLSEVDYLTVNEAVEQHAVSISEVSFMGSVPQMKVVNKSARPLFIPDGMTLVGCKQNRVVNLSLLVSPNSETLIPVSCVEAGRWCPDSGESLPADICDAELRSAMCDQTSSSLVATGAVGVNQGDVWEHVSEKLHSTRSHSPTSAYHAVFDSPAAKQRREIPYREGTCGVVVFYRGQICSLDVFDKPGTLKTYWDRIVRSTVALESMNSGWEGELEDPRTFLANTLGNPQGEFSSIGEGTNCRFRSPSSVGAALLFETQPLHVTAFRCRDVPVPPPADTKPNDNPPTRRSWWRFWE